LADTSFAPYQQPAESKDLSSISSQLEEYRCLSGIEEAGQSQTWRLAQACLCWLQREPICLA